GMPVFYGNRIYLAGGGDVFWGKNEAWLKCLDAARTGDITTNGLLWSYPLQKHVMSTPAIYDGMIFIADCGRAFHCVDAETGKPYWTEEIKGDTWASPLVADGKVYLGTRSGNVYVFAASKQKNVLANVELSNPITATDTAANGVLYVATMTRLYALQTGTNSGQGYGTPIPPDRIISDFKRIRAADPSRPVLLNLGQGVAFDNCVRRIQTCRLL